MSWKRLSKGGAWPWSTASFRLAVLFSLIFGLGGAALLLFLDWNVARFAEREVRQALVHQMEIMRADADLEGGQALVNVLRQHERSSRVQRYVFLVETPDGAVFSTGLSDRVKRINGFGRLDGDPADGSGFMDLLVFTEYADDGSFMAVGRSTLPLDELRRGLGSVGLWTAGGILCLAVLGGVGVGLLVLRSLERVNLSVARIVAGKTSERLPAMGFGSEFDDLARSLNHMLERQEATMTALRQVSEDVAHDLRTPLNRVRNRLEDLTKTLEGDERRRADGALDELDGVMELLNGVLDLAQLQGGTAPRAFFPLTVGDVVGPLAEAYRPIIEEGGGDLRLRGAMEVEVLGDAVLLKRAISNLIENALAHGPAGVSVELGVKNEGHIVLFTIEDDGPGIPEGERERVVARFYRMDRSRTVPGSGLGLALSSAVAELHGGSLQVAGGVSGVRIEFRIPSASS